MLLGLEELLLIAGIDSLPVLADHADNIRGRVAHIPPVRALHAQQPVLLFCRAERQQIPYHYYVKVLSPVRASKFVS